MDRECPICRLAARSDDPDFVADRGLWRIRHHAPPAPLAGWLIVDLVRHAATIADLTAEEAASLGHVLAEVSRAIRSATRCDRVYVLSFAESVEHAHLHLVPRHARDPRTRSWCVADLSRAVEVGHQAPAEPQDVRAARESIARLLASR